MKIKNMGRQKGYSGSDRFIRTYLTTLYPAPPEDPAVFETAPGEHTS